MNDKTVKSEIAGTIHPAERDLSLGLHQAWPAHVAGWTRDPDYLSRTIDFSNSTKLWEGIIRFPSAPVYGIHRKNEYQARLDRINYHTMRLLRRPWSGDSPPQIERVYLVHNGLNELDTFAFYYDLANNLLDNQSACIIRPLPGHLTRFPLPPQYAERPLDRYLNDAGDLFRQYLRHMLETQWLLSALVPIRSYRVVPGLGLIAEDTDAELGRESEAVLASNIHAAWTQAFRASEEAGRSAGMLIHPHDVENTIQTLRRLLGWTAPRAPAQILANGPKVAADLLPMIHVIGYSLGGFVAQSAFFCWPYAIASCTSLCSGGALSEVRPKEFAHPEEWQSVMHALRFELESAMMDGTRLRLDANGVAGIRRDDFSYFYRVFHEVFLQEFRGAYRSRLSEYILRLLFVLGGQDPIVSTRSVLEASPQEGINLIQVANLGHFLRRPARDWHDFWLPRIGEIMRSFSQRAELHLFDTLRLNWQDASRTSYISGTRDEQEERRVPGRVMLGNVEDQALISENYQMELSTLVAELRKGGWLMLLRNDIPAALQGPRRIQRRGTLHHEDDYIRSYVEGLRSREESLIEVRDRVTVIIPRQLKTWFVKKQPIFSAKGEALAGRIPTGEVLRDILAYFYATWQPNLALREFDPQLNASGRYEEELTAVVRTELGVEKQSPIVNTLPNIWMFWSEAGLSKCLGAAPVNRRNVGAQLMQWAYRLSLERAQRGRERPRNRRSEAVQDRLTRELLADEAVRIVRVSSSELNPRFMGERVRALRSVAQLVIHAGLAYAHSIDAAPLDQMR